MSRRKRNTWQPNEITSIIRSSQESFQGDAPPTQTTAETHGQVSELSEDNDSPELQSERETGASDSDQTIDVGIQTLTNSKGATQEIEPRPMAQISSDKDSANSHVDLAAIALQALPSSSQDSETSSASQKESLAVKVNQSQEEVMTPRKLRRTSSMVRMAMSLDGKASVILRGNTPSPPSKKTLAPKGRLGLQRSQSLVSTGTKSSLDMDIFPQPAPIPRMHGRSRDTRTWEFYCDSDLRESLTKAAEDEQRGSAAGAISLIRSSSGSNKPHGTSLRKSFPSTEQTSRKRKSDSGFAEQRSKFARTASSHARLQSTNPNSDETRKAGPKPGSTLIWQDSSDDSDKENKDPTGQQIVRGPKTLDETIAARAHVLQENDQIPSHSSSLGVLMDKEKAKNTPLKRQRTKQTMAGKENFGVDKEVTDFMKGRGGREEEDRLAVENLLSLRGGAWR
jgi:hypothetical protein